MRILFRLDIIFVLNYFIYSEPQDDADGWGIDLEELDFLVKST